MKVRGLSTTALFLLVQLAYLAPARAEIIGLLEAPVGFASQISNVQGWVYTTTPGAELFQPFDVFIDGVKVQQVPCCSDRGDVQDANPGAPLQTGFSGVVNWSREALASDGEVLLTVVVTDTAGGELVLAETLQLYELSSEFPFAKSVRFLEVASPAGGPALDARCRFANVAGPGEDDVAQFECTGLRAEDPAGGDSYLCSGWMPFTWEKGAQGFRQSRWCLARDRFDDNGDGTATDSSTGLMWELKTGEIGAPVECEGAGGVGDDPSCEDPHDVNNRYQWSPGEPGLRDGSAYTVFLDQLNAGMSADSDSTHGCFAGYCDWRLPTIAELRLLADPCDEVPCGSPLLPGVTASDFYWSSTAAGPFGDSRAWDVDFITGGTSRPFKSLFEAVRAVRGPVYR